MAIPPLEPTKSSPKGLLRRFRSNVHVERKGSFNGRVVISSASSAAAAAPQVTSVSSPILSSPSVPTTPRYMRSATILGLDFPLTTAAAAAAAETPVFEGTLRSSLRLNLFPDVNEGESVIRARRQIPDSPKVAALLHYLFSNAAKSSSYGKPPPLFNLDDFFISIRSFQPSSEGGGEGVSNFVELILDPQLEFDFSSILKKAKSVLEQPLTIAEKANVLEFIAILMERVDVKKTLPAYDDLCDINVFFNEQMGEISIKFKKEFNYNIQLFAAIEMLEHLLKHADDLKIDSIIKDIAYAYGWFSTFPRMVSILSSAIKKYVSTDRERHVLMSVFREIVTLSTTDSIKDVSKQRIEETLNEALQGDDGTLRLIAGQITYVLEVSATPTLRGSSLAHLSGVAYRQDSAPSLIEFMSLHQESVYQECQDYKILEAKAIDCKDEKERKNYIKIIACDLFHTAGKLFKAIPLSEFSDMKFDKSKASTNAKETSRLVDFFNRVNALVINRILAEVDVKRRARLIEFYVDLANYLVHKKNDFCSSHAIWSGLEHTAICRMKTTISQMSERSRVVWSQLNELYTPINNNETLRQVLSKFEGKFTQKVYIPSLTLIHKDLRHIEENITWNNGNLNFHKLQMFAAFAWRIRKAQLQIPVNPLPMTDILKDIWASQLIDDCAHALSRMYEPGTRKFSN